MKVLPILALLGSLALTGCSGPSVTLDPQLASVISVGSCSRGMPSFSCVFSNKTNQQISLYTIAEAVAYDKDGVQVFNAFLPTTLEPNTAHLVAISGVVESFTLPPITIKLKIKLKQ